METHPQEARGDCLAASPSRSRLRALAALLMVAACGHSDPFPSGTVDDLGPITPGSPVRLTLSGGADRYPAWFRDGSRFLYSYQDTLLPDRDRCLGLLPAAGGTRLSGKCMPGDYSHDTTDALLTSAASASGRVAWFEVEGPRISAGPVRGALRVGTAAANDLGSSVQAFPYFSPTGKLHTMAASPGWLGDTALVYVGAEIIYIVDCALCRRDSVVTGREIMLLRLAGGTPTLEVVPGTGEATSVSPAPDGESIFYTVAGDTRVFRRDFGSGAVTTAHDFGPAGIARDVSVADSTLVAIAGGQVSYYADPQYGPIQRDAGGDLYHVNLNSGTETGLRIGLRLRAPALSPDGSRIAVEQHSAAADVSPDLYLYEAP